MGLGRSNALGEHVNISEKKMFGGLCFMKNGNMFCGVHKDGGMFRVGKENMDAALKIEGVKPMAFTGRPMGGFVDIEGDVIEDDAKMAKLIALSEDFNATLPEK